ncbi:uncharacterized protein LOC129602521 [Paramacrobiotus metropolitanus]|uniref:uncharacterized protein LOC129602521 n=1 Tax=Paramacrobiotus metropolitanus TaxID=2943436 RepID=UPI002445E75E|nr:uncharacterized protein LOC129602521 [Paramacrobiotus metropolitanus]
MLLYLPFQLIFSYLLCIVVIDGFRITGINLTEEFRGLDFHAILLTLNSSAVLSCGGYGGNATWTNPSLAQFSEGSRPVDLRTRVDGNGTLKLSSITREDGGFYWCSRADNTTASSVWHVMIDPWFRHNVEMESITYGWFAGLGTLLIGITVGMMKVVVRLCCPQCHARDSAAARVQQVRQLIVNLEEYRHDQATRMRDNYNSQVNKLKESCAQQMESLRDHYGTKIARFRNYRLPLGNFREQYWQQCSRIRDYSSVQMERLQDNYAKNLGRLRTYSVVQLERFREQYKIQHKHMVKILEAMNFNMETCRSGEMTPGDSMALNIELSLANMPMESSVGRGRSASSDSITIEQGETEFIVQVGMEVPLRFEMQSSSLMDASSLNYATPPTGSFFDQEEGAPPVLSENKVLEGTENSAEGLETGLGQGNENGSGDKALTYFESPV